jgi:hypothetical protein
MSRIARALNGCRVGASHHRSKLSSKKVADMRAVYESGGVGYGFLAEVFGCGVSTARDIVQYRTRISG